MRSLAAYSSRPISAPGPASRTRRSASAAPRRATDSTRPWWLRSSPMATRRMRGERPHEVLVVGVEGGELGVRRLRLALAVVAGDLGDDLDLEVGQPGQLAVADHVVGVQVVLAVGDHQADVGQQGAGLEVLAGRAVEVVQRHQAVEQLDGEAGDVGRVGGVVVAAVGELEDAAPRHVAQVVQAAVVGAAVAQPLERVDEHAVAQRRLAERERLDRRTSWRPSPGSGRRRR